MASSVCTEDEEGPSQVIVRRFTNELAGSSSLEKATKEVQDQIDGDTETKHRTRMTRFYDEVCEDN